MQTFGSGQFTYRVVDNWAAHPRRWPFTDVAGVAVDSRDRVYAFTRGPHPVMVFDKDGNYVRSWGEGLFTRPHAISIDRDDRVWCTDDLDHTVRVFDVNGNLLRTLGTSGVNCDTGYDGGDFHSVRRSGPPFNRPTKAVVTASGETFVADGYGNARIHKFDATGALLLSWGEPGSGPGQFVLPHSVAVDQEGLVYVADRQNNRIQVFDDGGRFVRQWQGLRLPTDLVLDGQGHLFVSELSNRISVWDLSGNLLAEWGGAEGRSNDAGLFFAPHCIAMDSRGVLYVGEVCDTLGYDRGCRAIQKFLPVAASVEDRGAS